MSRLLLVSNRLPYSVSQGAGGASLTRSVGGLATGLCPVHESGEGYWIGWPGGDVPAGPVADQLRERRVVPVPLHAADVAGYYDGFSNGVLWPLFHDLTDRIPLQSRDWENYHEVNERFADAVVSVYQPGDLIWVHDYHLLLLPALLRKRLPEARIGFFLHIPFPPAEVFALLPARRELLRGLLAADVVGFHTYSYLRHFFSAATQLCGAEVNHGGVVHGDRLVRAGVYPMGVDSAGYAALGVRADVKEASMRLREDGMKLVVGIDRLDYTKGIRRRLLAIQHVLEKRPDLRRTLRFVQVATPSRVAVPAYESFKREIDELVGSINGRFGSASWTPIHYLHQSLPMDDVAALYLAADVMVVTPLRDGMNLVAKEFVCTRADDSGTLVLSEFAGAADELGEALVVNPYDVAATGDAIISALEMSEAEQRQRMAPMRARTMAHSVQEWVSDFTRALEHSGPDARPGPTPPGELAQWVAGKRTRAEELMLFLDYDGTLVPFVQRPEDARPDAPLLALLGDLVRAGMTVHIISGRPREFLDQWLGELPLTLHAEHGWWRRPRGERTWSSSEGGSMAWKNVAREHMEKFSAAVAGTFVEEKHSCVVWHFRKAVQGVGERRAGELALVLRQVLSNDPVEVLLGNRTVEARAHGANKGAALLRMLDGAHRLPVAVGDDRTDEDMFDVLQGRGISIAVGTRRHAAASLRDVDAVRDFLRALVNLVTRATDGKGRAEAAPR